jgi:chromate transporter
MSALALYLILLKATLASFSGFGSLPQVREELVTRHRVLSDEALNRAVLVARTTPGPMGVYVVSVGYEAAGLPGVIAGWLALATPALLVVPLCGVAGRAMSRRRVRGAISALVLASAMLIVLAGVPLATELATRWAALTGL